MGEEPTDQLPAARRGHRGARAAVTACGLVLAGVFLVSIARASDEGPQAPRLVAVPGVSADARATRLIERQGNTLRRGGGLQVTAPLMRSIQPRGERTAVVDRSEQEVVLFDESGHEVAAFICSTGVYYPLPGTYSVFGRKASSYSPDDGSRFYNFTMFEKSHRGVAIGFHSVPIDRNGKSVGGLGRPVSHGCVRVTPERARFLYSWATDGTRVVVVP